MRNVLTKLHTLVGCVSCRFGATLPYDISASRARHYMQLLWLSKSWYNGSNTLRVLGSRCKHKVSVSDIIALGELKRDCETRSLCVNSSLVIPDHCSSPALCIQGGTEIDFTRLASHAFIIRSHPWMLNPMRLGPSAPVSGSIIGTY